MGGRNMLCGGQAALQLIMADSQGGATVAEGQRQGHWKSAFAKLKSTNKSVAAVVDHSAAAAVSAKTPSAVRFLPTCRCRIVQP